MTEQQNQSTPDKAPYEKPAIEKQLSKEDLEREFLYAGSQTQTTPMPG